MCGSVSTVERPPAKGQIWGNTLKLLTSTSIFLVRCVALFSSPDMENNITSELSTMSKRNHRSGPTWWNKWYKKTITSFILGALDEHLAQIDPSDKRSSWSCLICGKDFLNKGNGRRHIETLHYETPSLECPQCGKILKNKNSFSNHMTLIHGHNKGTRKGINPMLSWWTHVCEQQSTNLLRSRRI